MNAGIPCFSKNVKVVTQIENPKLIQLIVTLTGLVGGAYFLAIANPPTDFYYLLPIFAMLWTNRSQRWIRHSAPSNQGIRCLSRGKIA